MVTALVIRLGPPSSVRVKAPALRLPKLIGVLKETSMPETAEFRGLGETVAIEVIESACTFANEKEAGAATPVAEAVTVKPPTVSLAVAVIAAAPLVPTVAVPLERTAEAPL